MTRSMRGITKDVDNLKTNTLIGGIGAGEHKGFKLPLFIVRWKGKLGRKQN